MYDEIGGAAAVSALIDEFYRRVRADGDLAAHLDGTDEALVKEQQVESMSMILGGRAGVAPRARHRACPIPVADLERAARHLVDALDAVGVPRTTTPERTGVGSGASEGDQEATSSGSVERTSGC